MKRPEVAGGVRLVRQEKSTQRIRRKIDGGRGRRLGRATESWRRRSSAESWRRRATTESLRRRSSVTRRRTTVSWLRRRRASIARRRTEARLLLVVAVVRILVRWRTEAGRRFGSTELIRRSKTLLRRTAESGRRLLGRITTAASTTVLIVGEGHRVERDGMTVRAVASAGRNVVAHLATKRTLRRRTVRSRRRTTAEASTLRRRKTSLRRSTAKARRTGSLAHGRATDVAKFVRRLRDRSALRTGIHAGEHIGEREKSRIPRNVSARPLRRVARSPEARLRGPRGRERRGPLPRPNRRRTRAFVGANRRVLRRF